MVAHAAADATGDGRDRADRAPTMTTRGRSSARPRAARRPHPVLLASRPDGPDAEASALVDLLDDALAHGTDALSLDEIGRAHV